MKTFARIENETVMELIETDEDPARLFHPALLFEDVTDTSVQVSWHRDPAGFFKAPPPAADAPIAAPTLAELQSELAELTREIEALSSTRTP